VIVAVAVIMQTMTRATLAAIVSSIAFTAVTAASTSPPRSQAASPATPGAAQDIFPETTGKAALMRVCSNCHTAENVIQTLRTRQEWSDVIDQMARFGAEASDQEFEQILTYLATHFSPIKINKAAAKELQATLDVPATVAEAIVAYRTEKGEFKTVDDLKRVPGLESARIEARKGRVVF
jgi:competence protein ComEA